MRRSMLWMIGLGVAVGCGGGGGGETPAPDPGVPADRGTDEASVAKDEVEAAELEVGPTEGVQEAEVPDICVQLACEETYKVFPEDGQQVCFDWKCDPVRGQCVIEFLQGVRCDDGIACTRMDTCVDGRCVGLVDECSCEAASGAPCSDNDPCTAGDYCRADGKCAPGDELDCSTHETEAGECRTVGCFLGVCMWSPKAEGEPCTSPTPCFLKGACDGRGHCVGDDNAPRNCDDGQACTEDLCDASLPGADPQTGCVHKPLDGTACDDGDRCTVDDQCHAGVCEGKALDCDDQNPCTQDSCDPAKGCVHQDLPDGTDCDDGSACTPSSACQKGRCVGPINCDDGDQCTVDYCMENACVHTKHLFSCNDGDPCTKEDRCQEDGQCRGTPVSCPSDSCNDGVCERRIVNGEEQGVCVATPKAPGTPCDDQNGCTESDQCGPATGTPAKSLCVGLPILCEEVKDQCNEGVCIQVDSKTHVCVKNPISGSPSCEDGNACTIGDKCQYGKCVAGAPKVCAPSEDSCEQSLCDPGTGECVLSLKTGSCNDGNACTVGDVCVPGTTPEDGPGKCVGTLINCDDLNVCTKDTCDSQVGCRHEPRVKECSNGTGKACTTDAECAEGGKCLEVPCADDGNPCTRDICKEDGTCQHVGRFKECRDGRPCNSDGDCGLDGPCGPVACADDGNECTVDLCWWDGTCQHRQRVRACEDGIPCLGDADCGGTPGSCRDVGTVACDDRDKCTLNDACTLQGTCVGTPRDCTDYEKLASGPTVANVCTDDFCDQKNPNADPQTGCYHVYNTNPCDDLDPCTRAEKCSGLLCDACFFGHCQGPILRDCADNNPCTADGCDQFHPGADANGCYHDLVPPGTSCDDLNLCTYEDQCDVLGHCDGKPVNCDDQNECTQEIGCDPVNGCVRKLQANGYPCDDSNACTIGDRCFAGVCSGPNPLNCDDHDPKTIDWCLPADDPVLGRTAGCQHDEYVCDDGLACTNDVPDGKGGCQFSLKSGWCLIDGVCYQNGALNPSNDCQACLPAQSTSAWTNLVSGTSCSDDGISCTLDQCNGLGTCTHPIASDWCRIGGVCYSRDTLNPSNDCQECNPSWSQTAWSNRANGASCADDGIACTLDQCNGLGVCKHPTASDRCLIGGHCYAPGDKNPSNDCQECNPTLSQTTWSNRASGASCTDDGDWCTVDQCDGFGTCTHPTASESCKIQGKCYAAGVINPSNDCQECNPALSKSSWSNRANGAGCADDGIACTLDQCNGLGVCTHPIASNACRIDNQCYSQGAINSQNDCKECDPKRSQTTWSDRASGASCASDNNSCTLDQCDGFGTCTHTVSSESCLIGGMCYAPGEKNPANDCQECNPALSKSSWSNVANGAGCTDDGIACTLDQCNGLGTCTHPIASGWCRISGQCYEQGTVSLQYDCKECNPALSQTAWSNRASGASCTPDNNSCTLDQCDGFGTCTHTVSSESCLIGETCYAPGEKNPTNACQECNPALSKSSWSNRSAGTACTDDGEVCTTDQCNGLGVCTHPIASGWCRISGQCYEQGTVSLQYDCKECNPALSQTAWSNRASGVVCASDNNTCTLDQCDGSGTCLHNLASTCCLIGGTYYSGGTDNPANKCQLCNPGTNQYGWSNKASGSACEADTPVDIPCTNDVCDSNGQCTHPVMAGYCLISGTCVSSGTPNPQNECQECNPSLNPTGWSAKSNGTLCSDGNACTLNDVCYNGSCQSGSAKVCTPPDQCHNAGNCNPSTGNCENAPAKQDGTLCDDGNKCTVGETCQAGECKGGAAVTCNDYNLCTTDTCDPIGGCVYTPVQDGLNCSSACVSNATCQSGQCIGTNSPSGTPCDSDNLDCTTDICNGSGACTHPIQSDKCLISGICRNNNQLNPANDCQACLPGTSQTAWSNLGAGTSCTDDGLTCTTDQCNGSGACTHPIQSDKCLISGTCRNNNELNPANDCLACLPGTSQTAWSNLGAGTSCADDGYTCTNDQCNGSGTCTHPIQSDKCLINKICRNNNQLNPANDCQACLPGTSQTAWSNRTSGSSCDDHIFCNGTDTCNGSGACSNHSGNPCPGHNTGPNCNDSCNEATDDCTANDAAGTSCADDGYACTNDQCNGSGTCTHPIKTGQCLISGTCYNNNDLNPTNDCQACLPGTSQTAWSNRTSGSSCDDHIFCNGTDTCNGSGACSNHSGNPCPGHNTGPNCNDSCNEATDDCTANDAAGTSCADDGNPCTLDHCDGSGTCKHPNVPDNTTCGAGKVCCSGVCTTGTSCP